MTARGGEGREYHLTLIVTRDNGDFSFYSTVFILLIEDDFLLSHVVEEKSFIFGRQLCSSRPRQIR